MNRIYLLSGEKNWFYEQKKKQFRIKEKVMHVNKILFKTQNKSLL